MKILLLQQLTNLDTGATIAILVGFVGAALTAFVTSRHNKLSLKVSENATVLTAWKEINDAQARRVTSLDSEMKDVQTELKITVANFHECEKNHALLAGKFEGFGILQSNQTQTQAEQGKTLDKQIQRQDKQGVRQDTQEVRQNEQEERQNSLEYTAIETVGKVIDKINGEGNTNAENCP